MEIIINMARLCSQSCTSVLWDDLFFHRGGKFSPFCSQGGIPLNSMQVLLWDKGLLLAMSGLSSIWSNSEMKVSLTAGILSCISSRMRMFVTALDDAFSGRMSSLSIWRCPAWGKYPLHWPALFINIMKTCTFSLCSWFFFVKYILFFVVARDHLNAVFSVPKKSIFLIPHYRYYNTYCLTACCACDWW